ncbi:hypothetical protein M441DRAFT_274344 [Trichoderma asperellum CBS 433.97]|uniref:Uncharacterized protein n=1 Tax=Trichoderma asperellum (strain ATCC 204424 / CBS 433.97 / NBRC 101777) TaxID=1042311 RepID=A0A2T3YWT8_TRIA4|nr:hypothetical protein M441DRAFT_274344 [Trichoderma asperellum CBS 433.97]PTB37028.1 hypothetical protein M441DRAFT_274344 [Trichoderma asperellum CBS 433.97]
MHDSHTLAANLVFARPPMPVGAVHSARAAIFQHAERPAMAVAHLDGGWTINGLSLLSALGLGQHPHPLVSSSCLAPSSAPASLFHPPRPKAATCCSINRLACRPTTKDGSCWALLHVHVSQILRTLCRHHAISQAAKPASQARDGFVSTFDRNILLRA